MDDLLSSGESHKDCRRIITIASLPDLITIASLPGLMPGGSVKATNALRFSCPW